MKQRKHTLTITVRFDKACTPQVARREVRDCIHGNFYCGGYFDADAEPEEFTVTRIGHIPTSDDRRRAAQRRRLSQ